MTVRFEKLGAQDRSAFISGNADLDDWFRTRAGQDQRRGVATVYVALDDESAIVGFYSLSAFSVSHRELPIELSRKLPRYDLVPAILIGRLARSASVRGSGIGEVLLFDALRRAVTSALHVAALIVVVDAKDEAAEAFYKRFNFLPFPSRRSRLFLPIETAARALP